MVELRVIEQLCKGIIIVKEALRHYIAEFIWEQRLHKHLGAVVLGVFFEFLDIRILHKHLVDTLDDYAVGIRKVSAETLIHLVNDALQGVFSLVRQLRVNIVARCQNHRLFVQNDGSLKGFVQLGVFQLDFILNVHKVVIVGAGQQSGKVHCVLILVKQVLVVQPNQLCNVGVRAVELAHIITGSKAIFLA